jgi:hypothetical protein
MNDPRRVYEFLDRLLEGLLGHENWHMYVKRDLQDLMTLLAYALLLQFGTWALSLALRGWPRVEAVAEVVHLLIWGGTVVLWLLRVLRRHGLLKPPDPAAIVAAPRRERQLVDLPPLMTYSVRRQLSYGLALAVPALIGAGAHAILHLKGEAVLVIALISIVAAHAMLSRYDA